MFRINIVLIVLISTFLSCAKSENDKIPVAELETEQFEIISTFRLSDKVKKYIHEVDRYVYSNTENNYLAITDRTQYNVVIIDNEGDYISHFGGVGGGPSELQSIAALGWNRDEILIYDYQSQLFKMFSLSGDLINNYDGLARYGLWMRSRRIFKSDSKWIFGIEKPGSSEIAIEELPQLVYFDENFNYIGEFGKIDKYRIQHNQNSIVTTHSVIMEDYIYANSSSTPFIHKYIISDNFRMAERIGKKTENFNLSSVIKSPRTHTSQEMMTFLMEEQSTVSSIHLLNNNSILALEFLNQTEDFFVTRDPNTRPYYLALYDRSNDYNLLGEITLPFRPVGSTMNGNLILLSNDDPDVLEFMIVKALVPNNFD